MSHSHLVTGTNIFKPAVSAHLLQQKSCLLHTSISCVCVCVIWNVEPVEAVTAGLGTSVNADLKISSHTHTSVCFCDYTVHYCQLC